MRTMGSAIIDPLLFLVPHKLVALLCDPDPLM